MGHDRASQTIYKSLDRLQGLRTGRKDISFQEEKVRGLPQAKMQSKD